MNEPHGWEGPVRAVATELKSGLGGHPTPDELLDYHADDLAPAERERIEDHLALCADCARTVLDLGAFPAVEPLSEEDRLSSAEVAAEWSRFAAQLTPARPQAPPRRLAAPRWAYALAAGFGVAAVGLGIWAWSLSGTVRRLSAPTASLSVADLLPEEAVVRAEGAAPTVVEVPRGSERVVLLLNVVTAARLDDVGVDVEGPDGRRVWAQQGLPPTEDGAYALDLPAASLPAGSYRIELSANGKTVARYVCTIRR